MLPAVSMAFVGWPVAWSVRNGPISAVNVNNRRVVLNMREFGEFSGKRFPPNPSEGGRSSGEGPVFTPENLDPGVMADFLGWSFSRGRDGWIFDATRTPEKPGKLFMYISRPLLLISHEIASQNLFSSKFVVSPTEIRMMGVKKIALLDRQNPHIPYGRDSPRIQVDTRRGSVTFFRDDFAVIVRSGKLGERDEIFIPFGRL